MRRCYWKTSRFWNERCSDGSNTRSVCETHTHKTKGIPTMRRFNTLVLAVVCLLAVPQNRNYAEDSVTNSLGITHVAYDTAGAYRPGS